MPNWYCVHEGHTEGPFSDEQVREMAASGRLAPADLVWSQDLEQPAAAATLPELWPDGKAPPLPEGAAPEPLIPREARRRPRWLWVAAGIVVAAAAAVGAWVVVQRQRLADAASLAPPGTVAVVHVDARIVGGELLRVFRQQKDPSPSAEEIAQLEKAVASLRSITVYATRDGKVLAALRTTGGAPQWLAEMKKSLQSRGNGRYDPPDGPGGVVVGAEASDVADDLILVAMGDLLSDANIGRLGRGAGELRRIARGADTSQPIWAAASLKALQAPGVPLPEGAPQSLCAWLDVRGKGAGEAELQFATEADAAAAFKMLRDEKPLPVPVKQTLAGKKLTVQLMPEDGDLMSELRDLLMGYAMRLDLSPLEGPSTRPALPVRRHRARPPHEPN